jgi:hypothetical protein
VDSVAVLPVGVRAALVRGNADRGLVAWARGQMIEVPYGVTLWVAAQLSTERVKQHASVPPANSGGRCRMSHNERPGTLGSTRMSIGSEPLLTSISAGLMALCQQFWSRAGSPSRIQTPKRREGGVRLLNLPLDRRARWSTPGRA